MSARCGGLPSLDESVHAWPARTEATEAAGLLASGYWRVARGAAKSTIGSKVPARTFREEAAHLPRTIRHPLGQARALPTRCTEVTLDAGNSDGGGTRSRCLHRYGTTSYGLIPLEPEEPTSQLGGRLL